MTHKLKLEKRYFSEVLGRNKNFELRKNDRDFRVGDILILREWDSDEEKYTGSFIRRRIKFILRDYPGLEEGYCILGV